MPFPILLLGFARDESTPHLEDLYNFAWRLTQDPDFAEELVTQAYADWDQSSFDDDAIARRGLFHLLVHAYLKGPASSGTLAGDPRAESLLTEVTSALGPLHDELLEKLGTYTVYAGISTLPATHRSMLLLLEKGFSPDETAEMLELPIDALQSTVRQAHVLLRRRVRQYLAHLENEVMERVEDEERVQDMVNDALHKMSFAPPDSLQDEISSNMHTQVRSDQPVPAEVAASYTWQPKLLPATDAPSAGAETSRARPRLQRWLLSLFVIFVTGLTGYLLSPERPVTVSGTQQDLISLSAHAATAADLAYPTRDRQQAADYVREQFGWRTQVPTIEESNLQGVAIKQLSRNLQAPLLLYREPTGEPIFLYVYNYAFLDRNSDRIYIDRDVLGKLEDDAFFDVKPIDDRHAVIWRRGSFIYVVVTGSDPEALIERIYF